MTYEYGNNKHMLTIKNQLNYLVKLPKKMPLYQSRYYVILSVFVGNINYLLESQ